MSNNVAALLKQLEHDDPVVRQDAAVALGDLGHRAVDAVDALRARLLSIGMTFHDRTCAAWALAQIVNVGDTSIIAAMFDVFRSSTAIRDAEELRFYCAVAIHQLSRDVETLDAIQRLCSVDDYWRCRVLAGLDAEPDPDHELARLAASLQYSAPWI